MSTGHANVVHTESGTSTLSNNRDWRPFTKFKLGMWATFSIITIMMAASRFYYTAQSNGLEVIVFSSLLVIFLLAGCALTLCETINIRPIVPLSPTTNQIQDDCAVPVLVTQNATSTLPSYEPPPPYHIAILLPSTNNCQAHFDSNINTNHTNHGDINLVSFQPPNYEKVLSKN